MSELPRGWAECNLEQISQDISYGYTAKSDPQQGDARMLRITDIQGNKVDWSAVPFCEISLADLEKYSLKKNDLVFARTGATVGKSFLIREPVDPVVFASYLIRVRPSRTEMAHYLCHYFGTPTYWNQIIDFSAGIGQPNVNGSKLKQLRIPLAPLPEQKRIADKLDSVLARVDACLDRLDRLPALLTRVRQSILAAATSGRLTKDWRLEQGERANITYPAVKLSTVAVARLGKMLDKAKNSGTPTPYLRNINVRWFGFDLRDIQEMRIEDSERDALVVKTGDLLICEGGEPGRCAIWHGETGQFIFQKALHRVRPHPDKLSSTWLAYAIKFAADNNTLEDLFTGTTIKHLTGVALANFELPLPPINEQHEIVRRVEILFAFADRLEARLATARKQVNQLTPALLAKAFRGELVPQDPADEPASEVLKRLAAQRDAAPKAKRGRKGTTGEQAVV